MTPEVVQDAPHREVGRDGQDRLVTVVLVDTGGWLLLEELGEHARVSPEQSGLVGGHVDSGEDFADARTPAFSRTG